MLLVGIDIRPAIETSKPVQQTGFKQVEIWRIIERENYRQSYDADFVASLASDMSTSGFKQEYPITVYANDDSTYTVIDGHTRRQAALLASTYDLKSHKAVLPVWIVVKVKPDDKQFKLDQLAANEKRIDPDDISKAIGYQQAISAGATIDDLIDATGHRRDYVENRLSLLNLAPDIQELVSKRQLSIKYACEITRLDTNFQRIAVRAYNEMKAPNLDEFRALVNELFTKQTQCSLFDLAIFNGQPIAAVLDTLEIERKKSRAELEAELDAERKARRADREYARQKYSQAMAEIARLKAELQVA